MIACVINIILIAISLLLLFLLRKKKYQGVKKIIILAICFVTGLYILLSEVTKRVYFIGNERMLIAHDSNRLRFS